VTSIEETSLCARLFVDPFPTSHKEMMENVRPPQSTWTAHFWGFVQDEAIRTRHRWVLDNGVVVEAGETGQWHGINFRAYERVNLHSSDWSLRINYAFVFLYSDPHFVMTCFQLEPEDFPDWISPDGAAQV
jgi:hypothetical protein